MGALRSERGLATSEYAGILAMLAGVFVAIFALGLDGRIATTVETAVCQILGGECGTEQAAAPEKCLTGQSTTSANANVLIAVVQIDKDSILIREDYSDGSSKFTIVDNTEAAGELFAGAKGKIGKYGIDYSAEALAGVGLEGARVFEFDNQEDADAFQETVQAAGGFDGILRDLAVLQRRDPVRRLATTRSAASTTGRSTSSASTTTATSRRRPRPTSRARRSSTARASAGAGSERSTPSSAALIEGAGVVKVTTAGATRATSSSRSSSRARSTAA